MTSLNVDVAIIGGGIMGCTAALQLRKDGLTVAVLEKGMCGAQASGINAGGVRQQGRALCDLPLARRAIGIWYKMEALLGEDIEFRPIGHIRLAFNDKEIAVLEDYARAARDYGLNLELKSGETIRRECGWLSSKVAGASYSPECGHANPRLVTPAFARAARRSGAHICEFTQVKGAQWTGSSFEIDAGPLVVRSRQLVNCTGAWAEEVSGWFGERVTVKLRSPNLMVTEPVPVFITRSVAVVPGIPYFRQVDRGNVVIGGGPGWGDMATERSRPVTDTTLNAFRELMDIVPGVRGLTIIRSWSGLEGDTGDRNPVISMSSTTPNLVHAFGFSGHGFQLGPAVGEVIAELVQHGESTTPIQPFHIQRFLTPRQAAATA